MNEKNIKEIIETSRQYAYFSSKRKSLEEYKIVLLCRLMKEIDTSEKTSIDNQKSRAKENQEYKHLLSAIKELSRKESESMWELTTFTARSDSFISGSNFDRKNNWNIHNI